MNLNETLETIRVANGGILQNRHVVEHARDPNSPIHGEFEWDDTVAGEKYRLVQAARLIARARVTRPAGWGKTKTIRAYVSISADRKSGGGFRHVDDVFADEEARADMLSTAMGEFLALQRKYEDLEELAPVFDAIANVAERGGHGQAAHEEVAAGAG